MSVSVLSDASQQGSSLQPFKCSLCETRFTRLENLKRHSLLHSRSRDIANLSCNACQVSFSRPDLRLRHLKRKHPELDEDGENRSERGKSRTTASPNETRTSNRYDTPSHSDKGDEVEANADAVTEWHEEEHHPLSSREFQESVSSSTSNETRPTTSLSTCVRSFSQPSCNSYDLTSAASFTRETLNTVNAEHHTGFAGFNFDQWSPDVPSQLDSRQSDTEWFPTTSQIIHGCKLFFAKCWPFIPILHHSTFDSATIPEYLLLSILCLAYQHDEMTNFMDSEISTGTAFSARCYQHARSLIAKEEAEGRAEDGIDLLSLVQAYLFLQIYAMMYSDTDEASYGSKTHSKMIALARAAGIMQRATVSMIETQNLGSLWHQFIAAEERKRTAFAIHQIDSLWYQFLSAPRLLSHLEIKHELPCSQYYWTASSAEVWAHRRLIQNQSTPQMQYSEAIRSMLSSDESVENIPKFDSYGAINITQFLTSSAREVSGWSTMTGMLSMDRLAPIRASLEKLGVLTRPHSDALPQPSQTLLYEATWQAAMIEMQMWSPTHTGGFVTRSLDAVLHHLTCYAPSSDFLCDANIAESVQPHVDWFLHYLDSADDSIPDAPWILLYAWKAFMIAWQLIRGGKPDSMSAIGVQPGDTAGALEWVRQAMSHRSRWKLGKVILACLGSLQEQG